MFSSEKSSSARNFNASGGTSSSANTVLNVGVGSGGESAICCRLEPSTGGLRRDLRLREIPRQLDEKKQGAFIASYENLMNSLGSDEAVLFADAVYPTHAARPVGCWAPKQDKLAIEQTSGRQRVNIHGAIDLETGQTRMIEVETVDAVSTIKLLEAIEALYPLLALIHVFLDNASYHHAKIVREWLAQPGRRIKLHFIPAYCPHLNPIERLWGVMHRNITHNKTYATCTQFADATLEFLREKVPRSWAQLRDSVTDNFRVISPKDFRVVT